VNFVSYGQQNRYACREMLERSLLVTYIQEGTSPVDVSVADPVPLAPRLRGYDRRKRCSPLMLRNCGISNFVQFDGNVRLRRPRGARSGGAIACGQ
jgi:hypothetical protein